MNKMKEMNEAPITYPNKLVAWTDLLMYYGVLVACGTIPFSIALATGGLFGGVFGWLLRCALHRGIGWKKSPLDGVILLFLGVQVFSVVFSSHWSRSLDHLRSYWPLLSVLLLSQGDFSQSRLSRALNVLIISGSLSALFGIGQYALQWQEGGFEAMPRISGTFGMYMTYAGILSLIWAATLNQAVRPDIRAGRRFFYAAALAVISLALVLTLTRNALLSVLSASAVFLCLRLPKLFWAATAVALLLLAALPAARHGVHRVVWGDQTPQWDTNVMLPWADQRPFLWKGAYRIVQDHPLAGVGISNFRFAYKQYLPYELPKTYDHAHNNMLHIAAETGVPGLIAYALLTLGIVVFLINAYRADAHVKRRAVLGGVLCAFVGFQVAGLFEFNFGDSEVALVLWILIGSAIVAWRLPCAKARPA